jgi:hypothetical protein
MANKKRKNENGSPIIVTFFSLDTAHPNALVPSQQCPNSDAGLLFSPNENILNRRMSAEDSPVGRKLVAGIVAC